MADKTNDRGFRQEEFEQLEQMHRNLSGQAHALKVDQKRDFDQIDKRYQQFKREWQNNQGGQGQQPGQRFDRQQFDTLRGDMQRLSGGAMNEGARRERVGAGAEEEEEEEQ